MLSRGQLELCWWQSQEAKLTKSKVSCTCRLPRFPNTRSVLNFHGWEEVTDPEANFSLLWAWGNPLVLDQWRLALRDLRPHQVCFDWPSSSVLPTFSQRSSWSTCPPKCANLFLSTAKTWHACHTVKSINCFQKSTCFYIKLNLNMHFLGH